MDASDGTITKRVAEAVDLFDSLDGEEQLELLGVLFEKMENGEIELKGQPVYPETIGVDDAYFCYATILDLLNKDRLAV